jgi:hypothetical protein
MNMKIPSSEHVLEHVVYKNYSEYENKKQARKGFRTPSAIWGIGYFQNLKIFLEIVLNFLDCWGDFLGFFEGNFWDLKKKFGMDFWEDDLFVMKLVFVKILSQSKKEGRKENFNP